MIQDSILEKKIELNELFQDENFLMYTVLYGGNPKEKVYLYDDNNIAISIIDRNYAIANINKSLVDSLGDVNYIATLLNSKVNIDGISIYYVAPFEIFTLLEISAIEASQVSAVQSNLPLELRGKGVTVSIIDTGIDYLNEEFINEDGETRIEVLWDQTLTPIKGENVSFGHVYSIESINKAIALKKQGGNPYDIVASVDEVGHGTNMAGVVGARGVNPLIQGMAPECTFAIVKLLKANSYDNFLPKDVNKYNLGLIISALQFLYEHAMQTGKPTVILLPLGTNNGNHKGRHIIDSFIKQISDNVGIVVATGTGNEGIQDGHVSGRIRNIGECETIEMIIAPEQKNMLVEIWVDLPNILDIEIISPSGEATGVIPAILNNSKRYAFIFERTKVSTYFYIPEEYSGDELIRVYFHNIQEGIWRLRLCLRLGNDATYNAWMLQGELCAKGTRFTPSDPYGTITIPGDSPVVVTAAAYNQNNNNLLSYSGVAFRQQQINNIDFAAGGVNTRTVGLNNKIDTINGTSLSAAIGAGACCLLLEWGIINKNYPYMYPRSIKTFLSRGTVQRRGDTYPNSQWGFGILNIYNLFQNMK